MRNCFVPWCDQKCRANPKRMMFNAPKDENLFKKWSEILPKRRIFKKSDKICERHFKTSDIKTTFDHVINGELFKMARGRPKLNENAIPSRNLPALGEEIEPVRRGRKSNNTQPKLSIVKKQKMDNIDSDKTDMLIVEYIDLIDHIDDKIDDKSNDKLKNDKILDNKNEKIDDVKSNVEEQQDIEFFEEIYEDIFEVVLPSTLWGIHRDPNREFIAFTYYDPKFHSTTKIVELTNKAILKVIICNKILSEENYYSEITYETITNMLNETDQIRICKMAIDNIDICQIKVNTDVNGEYCQMCSQNVAVKDNLKISFMV